MPRTPVVDEVQSGGRSDRAKLTPTEDFCLAMV
jgi:hypothetical protein